ncbi:MAG: DUF169 domain-containing protein [Candidatus Lokiarchaeota archaeon]|nr:DUF169 domain-containing protein [Candidatus Lokiarchaeota archaeon]
MEDLNKYKKFGQELIDKLKLLTYPIAIKIIKKGEEKPPSGKCLRPHEVFGAPLCTCIFHMWCRRSGFSFYIDGEDISCGPSKYLYYGLEELENHAEPVYEGWARYAGFKRDIDAEKNSRKTDSTFKPGEIEGFLITPLNMTIAKPDLVLIYCSPLILGHLILAATYDGDCIYSEFNGMEASCKGLIRTYQSNQCNIACPGLGDRSMGAVQNDEMMFFVPESKLEMVVDNIFRAGDKQQGLPLAIPHVIGSFGSNTLYGKTISPPQWKYMNRRRLKKK